MYAEAASLAAVIAVGVTLGVMFDLYRALHYLLKPRTAVVWFMDFFYTVVIIVFGFACLLLVNWAEFRMYLYLGILGGSVAYFYWCSRFFYRLLLKGADRLLRFYLWVTHLFGRFVKAVKNKVAKSPKLR